MKDVDKLRNLTIDIDNIKEDIAKMSEKIESIVEDNVEPIREGVSDYAEFYGLSDDLEDIVYFKADGQLTSVSIEDVIFFLEEYGNE